MNLSGGGDASPVDTAGIERRMRFQTNAANIAGAAAFVLLGLYVIWQGLDLSVGSLRRMGPGFFPVGVGVILAVLGAFTAFEPEPQEPVRAEFIALALNSLALLSFAVLLEPVGLLPATTAMVLFNRFGAAERTGLVASVVLILSLFGIGYGLFISVFGLPIRPF
ncbi:tripartite tricarboxylate transporter TctB family protein [uncultured Sulfitobacter sp.]|uniref:tripartite tricarboxylate transporter TctB family protein n=1 Tax=Sulfitobacter sp. SH22 TaxID=3421172 RepID=UPI0025D58BB2|nr:tripartite tricarboxylate transporter TctB family protein [uncultured Sulfitobacter sp.]